MSMIAANLYISAAHVVPHLHKINNNNNNNNTNNNNNNNNNVWYILQLCLDLEYSSNEGINNWTMFSLSGSKLIWMLSCNVIW